MTNKGVTPLFVACELGWSKVVSVLIEGGAQVNIANHAGSTPLFLASKKGNLGVVTALVEAGACVDMPNDSGETPLRLAQRYKHKDVADYLGLFVQ